MSDRTSIGIVGFARRHQRRVPRSPRPSPSSGGCLRRYGARTRPRARAEVGVPRHCTVEELLRDPDQIVVNWPFPAPTPGWAWRRWRPARGCNEALAVWRWTAGRWWTWQKGKACAWARRGHLPGGLGLPKLIDDSWIGEPVGLGLHALPRPRKLAPGPSLLLPQGRRADVRYGAYYLTAW